MTLYALEGLLARIARSEYREDFVLKGGVLLAAFAARRPTKDIDLQATRLTGDPEEVAERVRVIAALDVADGLVFNPASVGATTIRDDDEYAGVPTGATTKKSPADGRALDLNDDPTHHMVELRGFEPLTPCMPCRCATSCATAPRDHQGGLTTREAGVQKHT